MFAFARYLILILYFCYPSSPASLFVLIFLRITFAFTFLFLEVYALFAAVCMYTLYIERFLQHITYLILFYAFLRGIIIFLSFSPSFPSRSDRFISRQRINSYLSIFLLFFSRDSKEYNFFPSVPSLPRFRSTNDNNKNNYNRDNNRNNNRNRNHNNNRNNNKSFIFYFVLARLFFQLVTIILFFRTFSHSFSL